MTKSILDHIPDSSHALVIPLLERGGFTLKITKSRRSKLGDFRVDQKSGHVSISVNSDLNPYQFLFTFLHEYAHFLVWKLDPKKSKPHGVEWKNHFSFLLNKALQMNIYPPELSKEISRFSKNPKASTFADVQLMKTFKVYDVPSDIIHLADLEENSLFSLNNGRVFIKGKLRRSRVLCRERNSNRSYLIHHMAEVLPIQAED